MSTVGTSVIIEGTVKYRDGKKWKPRLCVVRKLSPVADCLHLQLYRDAKEREKQCQTKASLSLEGFLALESGFTLDKESNTLALICPELVVILAFDTRETLIEWQVRMRAHLEEDQQFMVHVSHVPQRSKIVPGAARLHLQDRFFCLTSGLPPRLLGHWQLQDLRRYGVVGGKFCFEGGSRCGRGEGLHVLLSNQAEQISAFFELASQGKLHLKSRALSKRNSVLECCGQRSLRRPAHWSSTLSSTESHRPLLTSSTSEISNDLGPPPSTPIIPADDQEPSKEGFLWHSGSGGSGSRSGSASGSASNNDVDSVDTMSIAISDIPETTGSSHDWLVMTPCGADGDHGDLMAVSAACRCASKSGLFSPSPTQHYSAPRACAEMAYDRPRNLVVQDAGWVMPGSPRRTVESASSSPRRVPSPPRPQTPLVQSSVPVVWVDKDSVSRRCPCGTSGPYANYAVPRSALCRVKGQEKQQLLWTDQAAGARERCRLSVTSSDSSGDYDYPKRIKECLHRDGACPICFSQDIPGTPVTSERPICRDKANVPTVPCGCHSTWRSPDTCPCQKVLYWTEHLVSHPKNDLDPPQQMRKVQTVPACDTNPVPPQRSNGEAGHSSFVDYANLEFMETLGLYENAAAVLSRIDDTDVTWNTREHSEEQFVLPSDQPNKCGHCGNILGTMTVEHSSAVDTERVLVPVTDEISSDDDGNYLPMQPACVPRTQLRKQEHEEPFSEYMSMTRDRCSSYDKIPMRQFMPLELGGVRTMDHGVPAFPEPEKKSYVAGNMERCLFPGLRTARSNSVVELKRRVLFLRKRSNSADGRRDVNPAPDSMEDPAHVKGPVTESGPVYAQISTGKRSPQPGDPVLRSSCVPCNKSGNNRDSASSSDSGVSAGSPRALQASDVVGVEHGGPPPLPPRNFDGPDGSPGRQQRAGLKGGQGTPRRMDVSSSSPATARKGLDEFGVSRCRTPVNEVNPPTNGTVDSKSTTSSTVSDLSDYIETLSMSSHGSTEGYGSTSLTNTLRPRSGREYQKMDIISLDEMDSVKAMPTEYSHPTKPS